MSNINDTLIEPLESHENISKRPTLCHQTHDQPVHQSFCVVKRLSKAKFPVYLAISKTTKEPYALKIFPYVDEYSNKYFHNEARFSFLRHPNIINFIHCEKEKKTVQRGKTKDASYILMEYAPYGDFFGLVTKHKAQIDEKLARTYFRQLIDGIEYLHENGIAHLDLKPENLLLAEDFNLKIIDFDLSYMDGDPKVLSNGTKFYRGPEFFRTKVKSTYAADIYSAGVFLFIMKSEGMYPHAEDDGPDRGDYVDMMYADNKRFWEKHCEMEKRDKSFYDSSFKQLFNNMVRDNPDQRYGIKQIKKSKWYNGPVYTSEELYHKMRKIINS